MLRVIAKIIGFHGIKGELKLQALVDDISQLDELETVVIAGKSYEIQSYREHKNAILLKVLGLDDLTSAERLFNHKAEDILVYADLTEDLAPGEIYLEDLKGMSMIDADSGAEIAIVETCFDGLQVLLSTRLKSDGRELLVPLVAEYIIEVDTINRVIRARISPDLLELAK